VPLVYWTAPAPRSVESTVREQQPRHGSKTARPSTSAQSPMPLDEGSRWEVTLVAWPVTPRMFSCARRAHSGSAILPDERAQCGALCKVSLLVGVVAENASDPWIIVMSSTGRAIDRTAILGLQNGGNCFACTSRPLGQKQTIQDNDVKELAWGTEIKRMNTPWIFRQPVPPVRCRPAAEKSRTRSPHTKRSTHTFHFRTRILNPAGTRFETAPSFVLFFVRGASHWSVQRWADDAQKQKPTQFASRRLDSLVRLFHHCLTPFYLACLLPFPLHPSSGCQAFFWCMCACQGLHQPVLLGWGGCRTCLVSHQVTGTYTCDCLNVCSFACVLVLLPVCIHMCV